MLKTSVFTAFFRLDCDTFVKRDTSQENQYQYYHTKKTPAVTLLSTAK